MFTFWQSAFVLCRLFEKNDDKVEGSTPAEHEPSAPSPTAADSTEETVFEVRKPQVTPVEKKEEEQPRFAEGCSVGENPEEMTPESSVPVDCCSNPSVANDEDDQLGKLMATEVRKETTHLKLFNLFSWEMNGILILFITCFLSGGAISARGLRVFS